MRWNTIYLTESMQDKTKKVIRIHDIGDAMNVRLEMQIGALKFSDPTILAIVLEYHTNEVAELLSKKLGYPVEKHFEDPLADVPLE